jgi:hypothetical protein
MAKRKSRPKEKPAADSGFNLQQTITQSVVAWDDVAFAKLLETQAMALGELTSIKTLLDLSKEVKKAETPTAPASAPVDYGKIQQEMLKVAKDHLKASRRTYKLQEDFQKEWDKEAKNIAEMAKGMKTFKTLGEKMADKKEGLKEKFGSAGGLKKTMLGALNVGGIFNKTLERDKFVEQQRVLGSTASTKDLKKDYESAQTAAKATKKTEAAIAKHKATAGVDDEEHLKKVSPEFAKLMEDRQSNADEFGKYQRATDIHSPTPVNRNIVPTSVAGKMTPAQAAKVAEKKAASGMSNLVPTPTSPELGKTTTATAAEATQGAEEAAENMKMQQQELDLLQQIADNIGGDKKGVDKKPEETKAGGGGFLDTIFSMLGTGLMTAFKALFNPMNILKALGKVFAIGMIIGALFEGVMDGFDEFTKSGDIGKALIAGLAGIIDFLTFGLFDKEKIKEVIGDFSKWTYDHLVKPFVDFIGGIKDSFMGFLEKIGIPEITLAEETRLTPKLSIGPFYPFKSNAKKPEAASPTAPAPQTANQVEAKSAENAGAKETPAPSNKTNVVNAPVTTNNNTTQVQLRPPIRNEESSQSRYAASRYA